MEFDDDFWEAEQEPPPRGKDAAVEAAKLHLRRLYSENPTEIAYLKQLQVWLEKSYFHWVTGFAVRDLLAEGFLSGDLQPVGSRRLGKFVLKFIYKKGNRYRARAKKAIGKIVAWYSEPEVARAAGIQAQSLFLTALLKRGFSFEGENTNEFAGKKWVETEHDLDFIVSRDGVTYGFEVKNRLEYIGREELILKLRLCEFLEIKPVFIMRGSPKTYNNLVIEEGGYAWIFETQIYPPGLEELVKKMREVLRLPVVCSHSIPDGMVTRFENWHKRGR
jgi:hypothetical protein